MVQLIYFSVVFALITILIRAPVKGTIRTVYYKMEDVIISIRVPVKGAILRLWREQVQALISIRASVKDTMHFYRSIFTALNILIRAPVKGMIN